MAPQNAPAADATDVPPETGPSSPLRDAPRYRRLRRWNVVMAVLHFVQGVAMVLLAEPVEWPITRTRYDFDVATETLSPATVQWIDVELPLLVAGFLFISALAHAIIATVRYEQYVRYLASGMNPYRWYEYAVSASLMIVVIAMLAGIWDLGTLVALFGLVAVMNLCGLVMERHNQTTTETDWTAYNVGVVAGAIPWIVIAVALVGSIVASEGEVPDFVLYIYVSIFVFFNLFAVNMILQYRETWRWRRYLFGEKVYILLSLVAKSALAWQVYAGTLTSPI
ncbi:heliorhodopsin HeR [Halovivax gelatinilyticus]|uniref:heliorhodopsin HeR n=1 Tax=Halovivax gelatinilyticus TaxID=2961597 RepID=UPI0020CA664B|nr:heliorhodopsin HeR [Halovivax gelatinilyticus]